MNRLRLPIVFPRAYQYPVWGAVQRGVRRIVMTHPRRAGKDLTNFSMMVSIAVQEPGNYYYMFPTREWAKRSLWNNMPKWTNGKYLIDLLCPEEIVTKKNNSEYYIILKNGSRIDIDGTDSMNFIGQGGNMYVLSEFQSHKEEVTGFMNPIVRESDALVIYNGTLRGKENQLWKRYEANKGRDGWFTQWYTLEDTKTDYWIGDGLCINPELEGLISPYTGRPFGNIQDEVDSGDISYAKARQEYLNEAVSQVENGYYSREMEVMDGEGRTIATYDHNEPVYTFWDLGGVAAESDTTAVTFAQVDRAGKNIRIIDYYENSGQLRGHYFDMINSKPYKYGGHYIPHDGKRRNTWSGEGMAETALKNFGIEMRYVPKADRVAPEIEVVRRRLALTSIGLPKCQKLFEHLSRYHENPNSQKPCHKNNCSVCFGASHGADSARTMMMAIELNLVEDYLAPRERIRTPEYFDNDYCIV